jgi:hypothetical protein
MTLNNNQSDAHTPNAQGRRGLDRMVVASATTCAVGVLSRRLVLLTEETGVPGENHRRVASH